MAKIKRCWICERRKEEVALELISSEDKKKPFIKDFIPQEALKKEAVVCRVCYLILGNLFSKLLEGYAKLPEKILKDIGSKIKLEFFGK